MGESTREIRIEGNIMPTGMKLYATYPSNSIHYGTAHSNLKDAIKAARKQTGEDNPKTYVAYVGPGPLSGTEEPRSSREFDPEFDRGHVVAVLVYDPATKKVRREV